MVPTQSESKDTPLQRSSNVEHDEEGEEGETLTSPCPENMVLIEGDMCRKLEQHCLYNTEIDGSRSTKPASLTWACGEYTPAVCKSDNLIHMRFCIDKYEYPNKQDQPPQDWMSWYDAKKAVESVGKRLCTSREWSMAAMGPHWHPLPYGDGFHRDSSKCNFDRPMGHLDPSKAKCATDGTACALRAVLVPSGSMPECVSDYGVHDMAGNIDEWVANEDSNLMACPKEVASKGFSGCMKLSYHSGLMGGHVWHVRNNSFSMTAGHDPNFKWYETGTRGCKDAQ